MFMRRFRQKSPELISNPANPTLGGSDPSDGQSAGFEEISLQTAAVPAISATNAASELQLQGYRYAADSLSGLNIPAAWAYGTGQGVTVALLDDGFDPRVTATFARFNTAQSINFATGNPTDLGEPSGAYHGTATAAEIAAPGTASQPVGVAPGATIDGVKIAYGTAPLFQTVAALKYATSIADIVNNSWTFSGFGVGEPTAAGFADWYQAIGSAVTQGRGGLGDVVVFAAGNDRSQGADLSLMPTVADPRVIAVAATDIFGKVAVYSNPGASLLVSALGNSVLVVGQGGTYTESLSGTSFAAPIISGITALMLGVNPALGWRDVQEILADSAYVPPGDSGFTGNGAREWNGGGMHFSNDLGFGIVDANVAVNLARAWRQQSTRLTGSGGSIANMTLSAGLSAASFLSFPDDLRAQHVQVTLQDTGLLAADTELVLQSPSGTESVLLSRPGLVGSTDNTGGLDLNNSVITSNAFWGEQAIGIWKLTTLNLQTGATATLANWTLTVWGDDAATVPTPLVYTPEFAALAAADPGRLVVSTAGTNADTLDLIALPGATSIDLNGGTGLIDGVAMTVTTGFRAANADGSLGPVSLTGLHSGGSLLSGGDGLSTLTGFGNDTFLAGLGNTTIATGAGGSTITLSTAGPSQVTVTSGGGDIIHGGAATAAITDFGDGADRLYAQDGVLSFVNGGGDSTIFTGARSVLIRGGASLVPTTVDDTVAGLEVVTVGGRADVFTFSAGHAAISEVIHGFRPGTDLLALDGYAPDAVAGAIQGQVNDGTGGSLLTLSDGLHIDLIGIARITDTNFG